MLSECLNGYGGISLSSYRCVRFASEVAGVLARGSGQEIGTYVEKLMASELSWKCDRYLSCRSLELGVEEYRDH
jgi:hypothetical protein